MAIRAACSWLRRCRRVGSTAPADDVSHDTLFLVTGCDRRPSSLSSSTLITTRFPTAASAWLNLVKPRSIAQGQHAIELGKVPPEDLLQSVLSHAGVSHRTIQGQFVHIE